MKYAGKDTMAKKVTLADIAEKIGVSNVAVYKALSDKPGVSDELRSKIKVLADEMGYQANTSRKMNGTGTGNMTGNIGVIVPELYYGSSVTFYGQLYEKVVKSLYQYGCYGILELLTKEDENAARFPKVLQNGKVDGLIFLGQTKENYLEAMVGQTKLPTMFLDTCHPLISLDSVISDGHYGAYLLTNYLIKNGHRSIGFVGSVDATSSISDRYWGYRRALRENHIEYQEEWEIGDRDEEGNTYEIIMNDTQGLDALVCNCDFTAHIVIQNLEQQGYEIPKDISVVGFDNFLPHGMDGDRITSYEVDMEHMADLCVKTLIKKIRGKKYAGGVQVVTGRIVQKSSDCVLM